MNSVEMCRSWLKNGALFLDTETTGVDASAEIVEIAVINNDGELVYESLIRPKVPITPKLTALHGISNEMVADAPQFGEIYNDLCSKLDGRLIIAYGADFDARMIRQTCELYDLKGLSCRWGCAMQMYQNHIGREKRIKLSDAAEQCRVSPFGNAHRARADAETMRRIVSAVAGAGLKSYSVSRNNIVLYFSSASIANRSTTPAMEQSQAFANVPIRQEAELLTKPSKRRSSCFFHHALILHQLKKLTPHS